MNMLTGQLRQYDQKRELWVAELSLDVGTTVLVGLVSWSMYRLWTLSIQLGRPGSEVFQRYDKDGNGTVAAETLGPMMIDMGHDIHPSEVESMLASIGSDTSEGDCCVCRLCPFHCLPAQPACRGLSRSEM